MTREDIAVWADALEEEAAFGEGLAIRRNLRGLPGSASASDEAAVKWERARFLRSLLIGVVDAALFGVVMEAPPAAPVLVYGGVR